MIEIYRDIAGGWRFRVKGGNGEIVAQGEAYTRKEDAVRGSETLRRILTGPVAMEVDTIKPAIPYTVPGTTALVPQTTWNYKGKTYRVLGISETDLIQDWQGEWRPSVKYACEPDNMLRFYRADTDFLSKFERIGA